MKKPKKQDSKEITALLKKVQADFENYQKRAEKEKKDFIEYSSQEIIKELLPVLDSFERALGNKDIKALYDQLWQVLESKGLEKIKALDQKFDPFLHEALMQEASDKEEGTVIEELQAGYKFKDNVIRPTKVKVSKK
ncbi:nucleotide exchange factor GrpE [Candidatus Woesearchaeota archaeon]|nr:nucleotide exchange factor GrpE [Candidatus Woesearchaeota archaeon]